MTEEGSHTDRNARILRELDRAKSRSLVSSHNAIVGAIETVAEDFDGRYLDDDQVEAVADSLDQLEKVADSIRDDDRILDERLLSSTPEVTLHG